MPISGKNSEFLTLEDLEKLVFIVAKKNYEFDEPIPPFNTRFKGLLESALGAPQRSVGGELMYPTLEKQAAVLFYELNKRHAFLNGNKRIACISLLTFLMVNKQWLEVDWELLYKLAIYVSSSNREEREHVMEWLIDFLEKGIVPLN